MTAVRFIVGGKYMGKLRYARSLCGEDAVVCDLARESPENMFDADIVANLQEGIRTLLARENDARRFFEENLDRLRGKILVGDEIGGGIVPMDPFERRWRDETGFVYQTLARRAEIVERVWAGLPERLKGQADAPASPQPRSRREFL